MDTEQKKQEPSTLQSSKSTTSTLFNFIKAGVWDGIPDVKEQNGIWAKMAFAGTMDIMFLYAGVSLPPVLIAALALTGVKKIYEGTYSVGHFAYSHVRTCASKNQKKDKDAESDELKESTSVKLSQ